jgi:hypothetical protein|nr:MAG TPA: hypothetical protein [Caudoviricetes sp.]
MKGFIEVTEEFSDFDDVITTSKRLINPQHIITLSPLSGYNHGNNKTEIHIDCVKMHPEPNFRSPQMVIEVLESYEEIRSMIDEAME